MVAYRHPTGVFGLEAPGDWTVADDTARATITTVFAPPLPGDAWLQVYIVSLLDSAQLDMDRAVDEYFAKFWGGVPADAERAPQPDGSLRLSASAPAPSGAPGSLSVLFAQHGPYFAALEYVVSVEQYAAQLPLLEAISNSFAVDESAEFGPGHVQGAVTGDWLPVSGMFLWQTSDGDAVLTGEVRNLYTEPLEFVQVGATLRDAAGTPLAAESAYVLGDVVPVDGFAPFAVRFFGVEYTAIRTFEMRVAGDPAEFLLPAWYGGEENLALQDRQVAVNPDGAVKVAATIANVGGRTAEAVRLIITLFDEADHVVASEFAYASPERLAPGETASVERTITSLGGKPATFTLRAEGKAAAP